jgi:hypothetical protein
LSRHRTGPWRLGRRVDAKPAWQRPGAGQVAVGFAVPVCVTIVAGLVARIRTLESVIWAFSSVALTGGLIVFLNYFVEYVIRPA